MWGDTIATEMQRWSNTFLNNFFLQQRSLIPVSWSYTIMSILPITEMRGFYGSQDLFWQLFKTFRLVKWKVLIVYCSQTRSCTFSPCLYLLEWRKSFHLSEISTLAWIPRQNFTEGWAPLKFLLFPIRRDFLLPWRKIRLFRVSTFLTQLLGMGCNSSFVGTGPCSELSWPSWDI